MNLHPIKLLIPMVVIFLAGTTDSASSCVGGTFRAGQPGQLSCQFDQDISVGQIGIDVTHYLSEIYESATSSTILGQCNWVGNRLSCSKTKDGFVFDNTVRVSNRLTINIPQVQSSMEGFYVCDIVGDSSPTPCNITVLDAPTTTGDPAAPTPEPITKKPTDQMPSRGDTSPGTTIVIIILAIVLAVVVVLALGCLLVMRCKCRLVPRNRKDRTDSENPEYSDSWDDIICCKPFNSCVHKTGSAHPIAEEKEGKEEEKVLLQDFNEKTGGQGPLRFEGGGGEGVGQPPDTAANHDGPHEPVREDNPSPIPASTTSRQPEQAAVKQPPPKDPEEKLDPDHAAPIPSVQVAVHPKEDQPPTPQPSGASSEQSKCSICLGTTKVPKSLSCGHTFCTACIEKWLKTKNTCPDCNKIVGTLLGDQPEDGTMAMTYSKEPLLGYSGAGSFIIKYHFQAGRQQDNHPTPGKRYDATERLAYLPDTEEGRKVLMLLRIAFDRRLTFTIGQSLTSGSKVEGIIWNDIHHKTFRKGGQAQYGYPDKGYLARVQEDLTKKGVTEADLTKVQREFIRDPHSVCLTYDSDSNQDFSAVFSG